MKVLVGLSGGVDSSVVALILKEKGYSVIGATMSIWRERPGFKAEALVPKCTHGACYGPDEKEDIEAAQEIAKKLDIPYYVFDCADDYEEIVLKNFKEEYLGGRTPNPCVRCNALVKFGVLPYLARKSGLEFDKFATGHYARLEVSANPGARLLLKRARDLKKDQSYFLYRLKQEQLQNILFPLGDFTKDEIRAIAKNAGLDTAEKPDSQDFYSGDYNELLNLSAKNGNIIDKDGKILGQHNGIWNFTVGQRKGLNVSSNMSCGEPLYVLELRAQTNEVVVGPLDETFKKSTIVEDLNFVSVENPAKGGLFEDAMSEKTMRAGVKIRSNGAIVPCDVIIKKGYAEVYFDVAQKSVAPGQSAVFYDGDTLLF